MTWLCIWLPYGNRRHGVSLRIFRILCSSVVQKKRCWINLTYNNICVCIFGKREIIIHVSIEEKENWIVTWLAEYGSCRFYECHSDLMNLANKCMPPSILTRLLRISFIQFVKKINKHEHWTWINEVNFMPKIPKNIQRKINWKGFELRVVAWFLCWNIMRPILFRLRPSLHFQCTRCF